MCVYLYICSVCCSQCDICSSIIAKYDYIYPSPGAFSTFIQQSLYFSTPQPSFALHFGSLHFFVLSYVLLLSVDFYRLSSFFPSISHLLALSRPFFTAFSSSISLPLSLFPLSFFLPLPPPHISHISIILSHPLACLSTLFQFWSQLYGPSTFRHTNWYYIRFSNQLVCHAEMQRNYLKKILS